MGDGWCPLFQPIILAFYCKEMDVALLELVASTSIDTVTVVRVRVTTSTSIDTVVVSDGGQGQVGVRERVRERVRKREVD
jgi:hypothetical protein